MPFVERYDLLINPYRGWAEQHRPIPENVHEVPCYEPGVYDFAILHVDQQSIYDPEHGDRISKGRLYTEVNDLIQDIPKIVINHMTPFHDKYESHVVVQKIKELVGDNTMVVNSHTAKQQWGWGNPIIHGYNVDEWWDLPKEPRAIVTLSPAGMNKAYRREFLFATQRILKEMGVPFIWVGVDRKFKTWDEYRDFIGRSLVYFNPTWQSPRPGARTEAQLSGACIVTTPYQDADSYIEDGKNGFLTSAVMPEDPRVMDSPRYTANLIKRLVMDEPELAYEIGQEGKKVARELFTVEKLTNQWLDLLRKEKII